MFRSLLTEIEGGNYDHGNAMTSEDNHNGCVLISFDTSVQFCPTAYFDPVDQGRLNLQLQSASGLI